MSSAAPGGKEVGFVNDAVITTKIKTSLFRDPMVSGFQINVNTYRGVVQLSGFVDTIEQKQRAGELAGGIDGVQAFHNDLIVTSSTGANSSDINRRITPPGVGVVQSNQGGRP